MRDEHDDGGPAFFTQELNDGWTKSSSPGMTLRDYFAAKLIAAGMIANPPHLCDWSWHDYARDAYGMADAMLKARSA